MYELTDMMQARTDSWETVSDSQESSSRIALHIQFNIARRI